MTAAKGRRPAKKTAAKKTASASAAARRAEAEDGIIIVEQCGVTLRIPVGGKTPMAAVDAYLAGNDRAGNKALLGEEQWQALSDAGATEDDLLEIADKITEAVGN